MATHLSLAEKDSEYFTCLKIQHNQQEQVMMGCAKFSEKALEASYLVTETLTTAKQSHKTADCTVVINKMLGLQEGKAISKA